MYVSVITGPKRANLGHLQVVCACVWTSHQPTSLIQAQTGGLRHSSCRERSKGEGEVLMSLSHAIPLRAHSADKTKIRPRTGQWALHHKDEPQHCREDEVWKGAGSVYPEVLLHPLNPCFYDHAVTREEEEDEGDG